MKIRLQLTASIAASVLALFAVNAHADNTQQSKMKTCNADATAQKLSSADRKTYLKTCLSGSSSGTSPAATAPAATTKQ